MLCALVLFCGALASNEGWHHWFHHHGDGDHEESCAISLFASGGCDRTPSEPFQLAVPLGVPLEFPTPVIPFLPVGFRQDFRSRGPPALHA